MRKKIVISSVILLIILYVGMCKVYALSPIQQLAKDMAGTSEMDVSSEEIKNGINDVIGLIQVTGTGISVIAVTMLGIKYLLASPTEKADVKKQIAPILIGCILLFGAVNLVAIIVDFSNVLVIAI